MFGTVAPTPFDLNFSLFGIPVRIHPFFWLFSAAFGWNENLQLTLLWVLCVFVSILIHELGHALVAQYYGWPPHIVLYSFGGYASFQPRRGHTTARAVATLLAGPGAGFLFYGIVRGVGELIARHDLFPTAPGQLDLVSIAIYQLSFINLWWGLVNLLPVYPLDGGQIARYLLVHFRPWDGLQLSLKLSILAGALVAYFAFEHQMIWPAMMFGMLAFDSFQALQGNTWR